MILGITPSFNISRCNARQRNENNPIMNSHIASVGTDTVSFSGNKTKAVEQVTNTFEDLFKDYYEKVLPEHEIMGRRFVNALKSVAEDLKEYGFVFPKGVEDNAIKGKSSYLDKWRRSGSKPMDPVRSTLYTPNLYDLDLFLNKLLPAMEDNGYKLHLIPEETSGKKVKSWMFDLDFRLKDLDPEVVAKLPPEFKKCIGKPQKSGYEDIQIRFVDVTVKPKDRIPQELIILFGENYAKAKNDEHYYVYEITRDLCDKLRVAKFENPPLHSPEKRVQDNVKILRDLLNNTISKPLYINAKAQDFYGEKPPLSVGLSKAQVDTLTGLMEGIRQKVSLFYKREIDNLNEPNLAEEMEKFVSSIPKFADKPDKTIYVSELLETTEALTTMLKKQRSEDLKIVRDAQKRLQETIEKFGEKSKP